MFSRLIYHPALGETSFCSTVSIRDNGFFCDSSLHCAETLSALTIYFFHQMQLPLSRWFDKKHFFFLLLPRIFSSIDWKYVWAGADVIIRRSPGIWCISPTPLSKLPLRRSLLRCPSSVRFTISLCIFAQRLMTLLAVAWPLPKASVEYTWVQHHKLLLSALKSVGSPTQQVVWEKTWWMKKRDEKGKWVLLNGGRRITILLFMPPLHRGAAGGASPGWNAASSPLNVGHFFCVTVNMFGHFKTRKCRNVRMPVRAPVSVHISSPEALDSCQATVADSSAIGFATAEQTVSPFCVFFISSTGSAVTHHRSESHQAKSQSIVKDDLRIMQKNKLPRLPEVVLERDIVTYFLATVILENMYLKKNFTATSLSRNHDSR